MRCESSPVVRLRLARLQQAGHEGSHDQQSADASQHPLHLAAQVQKAQRSLPQGGARPVEHRQDAERAGGRQQHAEPGAGFDADRQQQRKQAEEEGPVALAERPVVAPRRANLRRDDAGHLAEDPDQDDEHDPARRNTGDERERQVEHCVGEDVTHLVEHRAQLRLHAVLTGEHAVDRVERHPREQDERHHGQHATVARKSEQRQPHHGRHEQRRERDLVCSDAYLWPGHSRAAAAGSGRRA